MNLKLLTSFTTKINLYFLIHYQNEILLRILKHRLTLSTFLLSISNPARTL